MNSVLRLIDRKCISASFVLAAIGAVAASSHETKFLRELPAGDAPVLLAMEVPRKEAKGSGKPKVKVDREGVILKGYDVVAYFKEGKPVKGNPEIKSSHQDATYLFSSAENKAEFDRDPAKYAPQYGGFCAYGIAHGVLADIEDPESFAVYNGKLYLCGDKASLKKFMADIDENIEKADVKWLRIGQS